MGGAHENGEYDKWRNTGALRAWLGCVFGLREVTHGLYEVNVEADLRLLGAAIPKN
jgi:hypothetical protein